MNNNQEMGMDTAKGGHHWMHFSCCWHPIFRHLFWVAGVAALVLAWVAGAETVWGYSAQFWFVNAITFGILASATPRKSGWNKGCGACEGCKDGVCKC